MGNKDNKKGKFGISTEDVKELRKAMREAAKIKGPDSVLDLVNNHFQVAAGDLDTACLLVGINMTRSDFGSLNNVIKGLTAVPKVKENKYADKKGCLKGMGADLS